MQKFITLLIIIITGTSCNSYYKAITTPANADNIEESALKKKYFILRSGNNAFEMSNVLLTNEKQTLECTLENLPPMHSLHLKANKNKKLRYKKGSEENNETGVLKETHIYIATDANIKTGVYKIPIASIQKIEVIQKDQLRTTRSHVIGSIIAISGVGLFALVIASSGFSHWTVH